MKAEGGFGDVIPTVQGAGILILTVSHYVQLISLLEVPFMTRPALPVPMRFRRLFFLCLIFSLMWVLSGCNRSEKYVQADVLKLRSEPAESAPEVTRVGINSKVRVFEKRKGWVKIRANAREGWTPASLLGAKPVTAAYALDQAKSAKDAERVAWLERAVALEPANNEAWKSLADAYQNLGNKERSLYVQQILSGDRPIYLAACIGDKAILQHVFTPGSGFRKLADSFVGEDDECRRLKEVDTAGENGTVVSSQQTALSKDAAAMKRELDGLIGELADLTWYHINTEQGSDMWSWFPQPKVDEHAANDACATIELRAVLGFCPDLAAAVTVPVIELNAAPATTDTQKEAQIRKALTRKGVSNIERIEVRIVQGSQALYEVLFTGTATINEYPGRAFRVVGWALIGNKPEPLAFNIQVNDGKSEHQQGQPFETGTIAWAKWVRIAGPERWIAIVPWSFDGYSDSISIESSGYWVVLVDQHGAVFMTTLETMPAPVCLD